MTLGLGRIVHRLVGDLIYNEEKQPIENRICAILYVLSSLIVLYAPYQTDSPMYTPMLHKILLFTQYGVFGVCAFYVAVRYFRDRPVFLRQLFALSTVLIFFLFYYINSYTNERPPLLMTLLLAVFLLDEYRTQLLTFKYFTVAWTIICLLGVICFTAYTVGIPLPYKTCLFYNQYRVDLVIRYIDYGVAFLYQEGGIIRLCGICNEPGFWGTITALLLCADGMDIRKPRNIIFLLAGLATTSVAFFALIGVYVAYMCRKNPKIVVLMLIGLIFYLYVLPNVKTGNEGLDYMISRIVITEDGIAAGNRSNQIIEKLVERVISEKRFLGFGVGYANRIATEAGIHVLTYKTYLIDLGIIGFLATFGSLFLSAYIYYIPNFDILMFDIIFFISVYQRPNIFSVPYFVVLYGGVLYTGKCKGRK